MKMHLKIKGLLSLFLLAITPVIAQESTKAHKDSLNTIIEKYYELNLKIFQANSTIEDINNVFALFSDDFEYVHPKYGGVYSRQDLYEGYVRNQENGNYNGTVTDIKIINKIIGLNAVAVEKNFVENNMSKESEMTLFEFKGGKISRIFEYW